MKLHSPNRASTLIGNRAFEWGRKTYVMGVINVTPDSFSGDGLGRDVGAAVELALKFQAWGADIVDVGGESTRPASIYRGSQPTSADEEMSRVVPVIEALSKHLVPAATDIRGRSVHAGLPGLRCG